MATRAPCPACTPDNETRHTCSVHGIGTNKTHTYNTTEDLTNRNKQLEETPQAKTKLAAILRGPAVTRHDSWEFREHKERRQR